MLPAGRGIIISMDIQFAATLLYVAGVLLFEESLIAPELWV